MMSDYAMAVEPLGKHRRSSNSCIRAGMQIANRDHWHALQQIKEGVEITVRVDGNTEKIVTFNPKRCGIGMMARPYLSRLARGLQTNNDTLLTIT